MGLQHEDIVDVVDVVYTIDPVTRAISGTTSKKNEVVQYDHNSERIGFVLERNIDGHDMSLSDRVTVQYMNEEAYGSYIVDDLTVSEDEENIEFTWLIGNRATQNAGDLVFAINFRCFDTSGEVTYNWSTQPASLIQVLSGLFENDDSVDPEFKDLLAELETKLDAINDEGVVTIKDLKETDIDGIETDDRTIVGGINELRELIKSITPVTDDVVKIINIAGSMPLTTVSNTATIPIASMNSYGVVRGTDVDNGISVDSNGYMYVNQISIDKLVQGEDDSFVLEGGSSDINI